MSDIKQLTIHLDDEVVFTDTDRLMAVRKHPVGFPPRLEIEVVDSEGQSMQTYTQTYENDNVAVNSSMKQVIEDYNTIVTDVVEAIVNPASHAIQTGTKKGRKNDEESS